MRLLYLPHPLYPVRVPHGVYPPLLIKGEGEIFIKRGEAPLELLFSICIVKGRGGSIYKEEGLLLFASARNERSEKTCHRRSRMRLYSKGLQSGSDIAKLGHS